jgi:hypothetical protein
MEINQDLVTNTSAIIAALGAIVFGAQKAIKSWSADRGDIQKIGIDTDLYARMNQEMTRLSKVNLDQEVEIKELRDKCNNIMEQFSQFKYDTIAKDMAMLDLKRQLLDCTNKVLEMQSVNTQNGALQ